MSFGSILSSLCVHALAVTLSDVAQFSWHIRLWWCSGVFDIGEMYFFQVSFSWLLFAIVINANHQYFLEIRLQRKEQQEIWE